MGPDPGRTRPEEERGEVSGRPADGEHLNLFGAAEVSTSRSRKCNLEEEYFRSVSAMLLRA